MINLLPPQAKQDVKYRYLDRLLVLGGILLALVILINLILVGGLWLLLDIKGKSLTELLNQNKNDSTEKYFDELVAQADSLNKKAVVVGQLSDFAYFNQIIDVILDNKNTGIKITSFNIKQTAESEVVEVIVAGIFNKRANFQIFVDQLEKREDCSIVCVEGVESPASNLIKESAGPFTLTVNISKPQK
jgi:hypothetical protein